MKMWNRIFVICLVFALGACSGDLESGFYLMNYEADFNGSLDGWTGDFADYPATEEDSIHYELTIEQAALPPSMGAGRSGLMVSGINYCDDLFMFIKRKITGLQPSTQYTLVYNIELASNSPSGSIPGENVYLKGGAVSTEPKKVIEGDYYRMNIDKGNDAMSGEDMQLFGNISSGSQVDSYMPITRGNSSANTPMIVHTNSKGELWLIVGTDSRYEGLTKIYYTGIHVVLSISE
jgi:hypothetical protein